MTTATLTQPQTKMITSKKWLLAAGLALAAIIIAGLLGWYFFGNQSNLPAPVSMEEFEQVSGIRPKMIAVTAAGGIIDFRYKVVDAVKANTTMRDAQKFPLLVIDDTGQVMNPGINHVIQLYEGIGYFIFFPNVGGVVEPGMELSIMVGDTRYGPLVVK